MQLLKRLIRDPDRLIQHSIVMSLAGNVGGVINVLYTALMLRHLSGDSYSAYTSLIGALTLISVPAIAVQMAIANFGSESHARDMGHKVLFLYRKATGVLLVFSVPFVLAGFAFLRPLEGLFKLDSPWPLILTLAAFVLNVLTTLAMGILQGLQHFTAAAVISVTSCFARLSGVVLVVIGLGAAGAIGGTVIANIVFVAAGYWLLTRTFPRQEGQEPLTREELVGLRDYFWPVLAACATTTLFMQIDMPLVRVLMSTEESSDYAIAGSVARTVAYLSGPIVMAMFPKIVSQTTKALSIRSIFLQGVLLCGGITFGAALGCSIWPELPLRILASGPHPELHALTRAFVWAFAPMPLYYMFANILMARRSFAFLRLTVPMAAVYVLCLYVWHPSLTAVLISMASFGGLVTLTAGACTYRHLKGEAIKA